ncbi:hypothetical protein PF008_g6143 [Phytophthora fragariae]|uniref:Hexosyltransferase n=1 Tax=Phytophthora fragariae TaxID=53985 RepID=A0A6G0S6I8_9STRA|nr:hypothetical protein PF008_g6143 [Phytophthora fragariae]
MEVPWLSLLLLSAWTLCGSSSPLTTDSSLPRPHEVTSVGRSNVVDQDESDPLTGFWIVNPEHGAVNELPIEIRFGVKARSAEEFEDFYGGARLCVELNGLYKKCKMHGDPPIFYTSLPQGNYTATAYIAHAAGLRYRHETKGVAFTLLSSVEYKLHNARLAERSREEQQFPEDIDILQWGGQEEQVISEEGDPVLQRSHVSATSSPMLVIGVKTAVVTNFPRRQAIRDSWADTAKLSHDVKVLFLGCEPNVANIQNEYERRRVLAAVAKERAAYGDLLTDELGCTDGYKNLTIKVASFMHLAVAEFPHAKFVMVTDDDVYVKVDQLAENLRKSNHTGLYFGEVWAAMFGNKQKPVRDQNSQYYLPQDQYPMSGLVPYVAGPHSVLSMDGVRFIANNYWHLRSLNGLDDVSVGLWLWSMQLQPQHTRHFSSVPASVKCTDDLVSFADLSPLGIRSIHANLMKNRSFCHGFHSVTWHQRLNSIPDLDEMLQRETEGVSHPTPLQLETYINIDASEPVTVIVSTPSNAGIKLQLTPSSQSLDELIQHFCSKLPTSPCLALVNQLQHDPATSDGYISIITGRS